MVTVAMQNDISTALRLFASIFEREADRKILRTLEARGRDMEVALGDDPLAGLNLKDPEAAVEALAVEYCRLFIGPREHLPPVESIVLGEQQFWGPSTEAVAAFYRSAGIALRKGARILPDHISMELDCLAVLEEQDRHEEAGVFARGHVLRWLSALVQHIDKRAVLPFYRVWAKGLHAMLTQLYAKET